MRWFLAAKSWGRNWILYTLRMEGERTLARWPPWARYDLTASYLQWSQRKGHVKKDNEDLGRKA